MQVVQTAAVPPNQGKIDLPMTSCTWKRRNALNAIVDAKIGLVPLLSILGAETVDTEANLDPVRNNCPKKVDIDQASCTLQKNPMNLSPRWTDSTYRTSRNRS
jgi:hypothetical protein